MVAQFLRGGIRAVPAGVQLSRLLMRNQGLVGTLGFLGGLRGMGGGAKGAVARFLDAACAGDEVGMRRRLAGEVRISGGDGLQMSASRPAQAPLGSALAQAHRIRVCRRRGHRAGGSAQCVLRRGRF